MIWTLVVKLHNKFRCGGKKTFQMRWLKVFVCSILKVLKNDLAHVSQAENFQAWYLLFLQWKILPSNKKLHGKLLPVHLEFWLTFSLFCWQNQQKFFHSCFQLNRCEICSCCRCLYCCWTHSKKNNYFLQYRNV